MKKKINIVKLVVASIIALGCAASPIVGGIMFGVDGFWIGIVASMAIGIIGCFPIMLTD